MSIVYAFNQIKETLPQGVSLVVVSKNQPIEKIQQIYNQGQRIFGENKVQELVAKAEHLPKDIQWHMIGNLQTNKVKYIAPFIQTIHSISSERLLKEVDKQAKKNNSVISCLLQLYIAQEVTKNGLDFQEAMSILKEPQLYTGIRIEGLMGMATNTSKEPQVHKEFIKLYTFYKEIQPKYPQIKTLSMGMSEDYLLAIDCGSNMVRIGSKIFNPNK